MSLLAASSRFVRAARATLTATAAAALVAGCGSDDGTSPSSVAGSYTLVSYDGRALPVVDANAVRRSELLSGGLNLREDRTFDITLQSRDTDLATNVVTNDTESYSGRYTVSGRTVTFTNTTNGELDGATASVTGGTATIGPFVFRQ
jgi:hypothetical protein